MTKKRLKVSNARDREGYSQQQTAEKLNISIQSYNAKENGKRDFSSIEMKILATLFNKTLDDLFWEDGEHENIKRVV